MTTSAVDPPIGHAGREADPGAHRLRPALVEHVGRCRDALDALVDDLGRIEAWGVELARCLTGGGRLLVAGNGGSAALAQHLSAEVVGRYRRERRAFDAVALHADTSTLTALVNDYGPEAMFARQLDAYGRPGDILLLMSTSGRSPNLLAAAASARRAGVVTWGLTGRAPNPLAAACAESLCIDAPAPTVQEVHQMVVHLLCEVFDSEILDAPGLDGSAPGDLALDVRGPDRGIGDGGADGEVYLG